MDRILEPHFPQYLAEAEAGLPQFWQVASSPWTISAPQYPQKAALRGTGFPQSVQKAPDPVAIPRPQDMHFEVVGSLRAPQKVQYCLIESWVAWTARLFFTLVERSHL